MALNAVVDASEIDDARAPWLIPPKAYLDLRSPIRKALGFRNDLNPFLIGIDGLDGAGKSSFAAWLSWQLEVPAIHLDLFIVRDSIPLKFRTEDLARALEARISLKRPLSGMNRYYGRISSAYGF